MMTKDDELKSIDWNMSLDIAHNNVELAKDLLQSFVEGLPVARDEILTAYEADNLSQLRDHIHKLYGASCYCGVPKLRSLLASIDQALKLERNINVKSLILEFDDESTKILNTYDDTLYR